MPYAFQAGIVKSRRVGKEQYIAAANILPRNFFALKALFTRGHGKVDVCAYFEYVLHKRRAVVAFAVVC